MNEFQIALLIAAVGVAALSAGLPRAWLWITIGALDFFVTTAYGRYGLPYPPFFTAMVDSTVCLAIFFLARRKWEFPLLYLVFQAMVLTSLADLFVAYLAGTEPHYAYVATLEALNWLALLIIGGTAILQRIEVGHGSAALGWRGGVHRAHAALFRKSAAFHVKPK